MKKVLLMSIVSIFLLADLSYAHMGRGMMKGAQQPSVSKDCPCPMQHGMGMMGHGMMGKGMMGRGMGMMGGKVCMNSDSPECKKFLDETTEIRKALHIKKFEYFEAKRNPDTPKETLEKLLKDIKKLKIQLYEKMPLEY